jgi:hypothetical protein
VRVDDYCREAGRNPDLNTTDRLVLWAMGSYVNWRTGTTWVALPTIAADLNCCVRTVQYAVRRLIAAGAIAETPRPGQPTIWRFPLAEVIHSGATGGTGTDVRVVQRVAHSGATGRRAVVQRVAPEPVMNHKRTSAAHPVLREACRCSAPGCDGFETTWHDDGFGRTFKIAEPCRHAETG